MLALPFPAAYTFVPYRNPKGGIVEVAFALYAFALVAATIAIVFSFFPRNESASENLAAAILLGLAILSAALQDLALVHLLKLNAIIDIGVFAVAITRRRSLATGLVHCLGAYARAWRDTPVFQTLLTALTLLLLAEAFFLPPVLWDVMTYHLARVMLMLKEGQFFVQHFSDYRQDIHTVGLDMLAALSLRFGTDYGAGLFGWWSFLALALGVHGLALALTGNRAIARTACLLAATLTMVLLHADIAKNDLILAAVTVVAASALLRFQQSGNWRHAGLAILILLFGVSAKISYAVMPVLLVGGMALLMLRSRATLPVAWPKPRRFGAFAIVAAGLTATIAVPMLHNLIRYGHIVGPPEFTIFLHTGGWRGGFVNLGRAWIGLIGFPKQLFGDSVTQLYDWILGPAHLAGLMLPDRLDHLVEVDLSWAEPSMVWYGLAGPLLVAALLWQLVRGHGPIRVLAVCAFLYTAYTAIFGIGWDPYDGRYYAVTAIIGVLCLAVILARIEARSPPLFRLAVGFCVVVALGNAGTVLWYASVRPAGRLISSVHDRTQAYDAMLGMPELMSWFIKDVPAGQRVLLLAGEDLPSLPFLLTRPDLDMMLAGIPGPFFREPIILDGERLSVGDPSDLQRIFAHFDDVLYINRDPSGKTFGVHGFDAVREALKQPFFAPVFAQ